MAPRRWRPMVLGAAVVATVTALVVAWLVVARPASETSTTSTRPGSTLPSPIGVGEEIPLAKVKTPQPIESSLEGAQGVPGSRPVTLQAGNGPSVTVTHQPTVPGNATGPCLLIEQRTRTTVWGTSSTCGHDLLQVFYYPEPETSTDATVYYAWLAVPGDAAYVSFESLILTAWQRPIQGIVVFPVDGGPVDAIARAYSADGQQLAEIEIAQSYNGAQYLPGQTPTSEPQPYSVPGGLTLAEECEVVPLSALGPGDEPTMLVHDHGTGAPIEFDKREYCRQAAALHPDPAGDIVASFYVRNGAVTADYFERVDTNTEGQATTTQGAPIPFDEAQRRIAAQRTERDF